MNHYSDKHHMFSSKLQTQLQTINRGVASVADDPVD